MDNLKELYDIIIIGAGPAGLNAGMNITKAGLNVSVLIVDKTVPWDKPIPCAEGVGKLGFHGAVKLKPSWIRQEIYKAKFHSPDGSFVTYHDRHGGYIINRALMQQDMMVELTTGGVESILNKKVKHISTPNKGIREVFFDDGEKTSAKVIIDASGPIGGFGKTENISVKPIDLEPSYFAVVENISLENDCIHIYAGKKIAPGGYAWVFPRGENSANIGIVLGRDAVKQVNLRTVLEDFIAGNFPDAKILQRYAGTIPCDYKKVPIAIPGLIKAGDSASTVNPISRAGISEALLCGAMAGTAALRMLQAKSTRETRTICKEYQDEWYRKKGNRHHKLAKLKRSLAMIPDEDYNRGTQTLLSIPREELTLSKIFTVSLKRFPRLVWAMRHLV